MNACMTITLNTKLLQAKDDQDVIDTDDDSFDVDGPNEPFMKGSNDDDFSNLGGELDDFSRSPRTKQKKKLSRNHHTVELDAQQSHTMQAGIQTPMYTMFGKGSTMYPARS